MGKRTIYIATIVLLGIAIFFAACGRNPLSSVLGGSGGSFTIGIGKL